MTEESNGHNAKNITFESGPGGLNVVFDPENRPNRIEEYREIATRAMLDLQRLNNDLLDGRVCLPALREEVERIAESLAEIDGDEATFIDDLRAVESS
jgi:hypothetical protein